jgi:hypothetical protein
MSFSVLAIICARNEIDILPWVVRYLRSQSVGVYLMDDWSTDGTWEASFGWDLVGRERFPALAASRTFDLAAQMRRKEEIAAASGVSWCMHYDADEIRRSTRPDETLCGALERFERHGYSAAAHALMNFCSREGWQHGMDPEAFFTEPEQSATQQNRWGALHVKAWKNTGQRVDLACAGGHDVQFPGRRVAPEQLLLKHYPLRGRTLTDAKLADRRGRWNAAERARGWHFQYDKMPATVAVPAPVEPPRNVSLVVPSKYQDIFEQLAASVAQFGQDIAERIVVVDGDWNPPAGWKRVQGVTLFNFSGNSNLGIAAANPANDVLLMNDDVVLLHADAAGKLQASARANPRAGLVSPRFYGGVGNPMQQSTGRACGPLVSIERLAFVAVLIPRATIDQVGTLDERFIGYGAEDDDYCIRVQRAGMQLLIEPSVTMRHGFGKDAYSASLLRTTTPQQREYSMRLMLGELRRKWA